MEIKAIRTPGLGDTTYVLANAGAALIVDPQRDHERFSSAASELGAKVVAVLETHVHNDYVSGGRELAARADALHILPAGSGVAYKFTPAFHLEEIPVAAGMAIRPIHTPGHTPEHTSYLVVIDGRPTALFSGGSLLVGSAGRPDLLGAHRARQLARLQYVSLNRLATLPEDVELYPTHGEGSFCSASAAGRSASTIGDEKRLNPLLTFKDPEAFADFQLGGLGPFPRYYGHMGGINLLGADGLEPPKVPILTAQDVYRQPDEVFVVDARPRTEFAAGHIPGSIGVEFGDDFGTWVGFIVPFDAPLVLVVNADQDLREAGLQLGRIGYEHIRGALIGMDEWRRADYPIAHYEIVPPSRLAEAIERGEANQILDVRAPAEWQSGHIDGSVHRFVGELADGVPPGLDPSETLWVVCASGRRANIAAGMLARSRFARIKVVTPGGVPDVLKQQSSAAHA